MTEIARLRVEIDEVTPAVIRRVEVPVTIRLDDLHFVLQIALGWQNCHPFEFRVGETAWGLLDRDDPASSPLSAETARVADVLALGNTFRYDYVYGEDWEHTVAFEGTAAAASATDYPRLVSAQGRCPPADIGGPPAPPRRYRRPDRLRDVSAGDRRSRAPAPRGHDRVGRSRLRSEHGRRGRDPGQPREPWEISGTPQGRAALNCPSYPFKL